MSFDTHHLRQRRRVDTPAVTMNIPLVAGSGTRFERDDLLDDARFWALLYEYWVKRRVGDSFDDGEQYFFSIRESAVAAFFRKLGATSCTARQLSILTQAGPDSVRVPCVLSLTPVTRRRGAPCDGFTWSSSWSS